MNIFGKLFGMPGATKELIDIAKKAGDALVFTEEERSQAQAQYNEWFLRYLEVTQPQTLARRFIAIAITLLWVLLVVVAAATYPISNAYSMYVLELLKNIVTIPFGGILAFYFTAQLIRSAKKEGE